LNRVESMLNDWDSTPGIQHPGIQYIMTLTAKTLY
jgi:hypothetical protein